MRFDRDGALALFKPSDTRGFSRIINDPPKEWASKVEARITAVKFTEPK